MSELMNEYSLLDLHNEIITKIKHLNYKEIGRVQSAVALLKVISTRQPMIETMRGAEAKLVSQEAFLL